MKIKQPLKSNKMIYIVEELWRTSEKLINRDIRSFRNLEDAEEYFKNIIAAQTNVAPQRHVDFAIYCANEYDERFFGSVQVIRHAYVEKGIIYYPAKS